MRNIISKKDDMSNTADRSEGSLLVYSYVCVMLLCFCVFYYLGVCLFSTFIFSL